MKKRKEADDVQKSIELISAYISAMNTAESTKMDSLRSRNFELDFVYGDAFQTKPISGEEVVHFWPAWLSAFPDGEFEVTRTIANEKVVIVQWTFSGTHKKVLGAPIMTPALNATDRIVCFRGVSIYDIEDGLLSRETTYMDLATIMVELGVNL